MTDTAVQRVVSASLAPRSLAGSLAGLPRVNVKNVTFSPVSTPIMCDASCSHAQLRPPF